MDKFRIIFFRQTSLKTVFSVLFLLTVIIFSASAKVVIYPWPANEPQSTDYTITINNQPAGIYLTKVKDLPSYGGNYSFVSFDMSEKVTISITSKQPLDKVVIRAVAKTIVPVVNGNTITFTIDEPCKLAIEPNGKNNPLYIFANPLEVNPPKEGDKGVKYYGPGIHQADKIELDDNETLYLAGGAVVKGAISAKEKKNIKIHGRGILDGTDYPWVKGPQDYLVMLDYCENVDVEGIILRSSFCWTMVPGGCDGVKITNMKICNGRNDWDDGIDIINSKNVVVDNCFIRTDDDCIAITGYNHKDLPTDGVTIKNCLFMTDRAHIFRLGWSGQTSAIRNVSVSNIEAMHYVDSWFGPGPCAIWMQPMGITVMENIRFENMRIYGEGQTVLMELRPQFEIGSGVQKPGQLKNVYMKDITVSGNYLGVMGKIVVTGPTAENVVENVTFENITRYGQVVNENSPEVMISGFTKNVKFILPTNGSPSASFTSNIAKGYGIAPLKVIFDASASVAQESKIAEYEWSFGDGTSGKGINVEHQFAKEGIFKVELTVRDTNGKSTKVATEVKVLHALTSQTPSALQAGVNYTYYESKHFSMETNFDTLTPLFRGSCNNFDLDMRKRNEDYVLIFTGFIDVQADGLYGFKSMISDGICQLFIDGQLVDRRENGVGIPVTRAYSPVGLKAGKHAIKVIARDCTQPEFFSMRYEGPGIEPQQIPMKKLFRETKL